MPQSRRARAVLALGVVAGFLLSFAMLVVSRWNRGDSARTTKAPGPQDTPAATSESTVPSAGGGSDKDVEIGLKLNNDILREMSEEGLANPELIRQLNEVLPYDKEIAARTDIPAEKIPDTPTNVLLGHFITKGYTAVFGLYDNPDIGIFRAMRSSRTLAAFISRPDMMDGFVKVYREMELDPDKNKDVRHRGAVSIALVSADELLMFPIVFNRSRGYEKQLLDALCKRYRKMKEINRAYREKYGEEQEPFGGSFATTTELAFRLLERVDKKTYDRLKASGAIDEDYAFQGIEEALK